MPLSLTFRRSRKQTTEPLGFVEPVRIHRLSKPLPESTSRGPDRSRSGSSADVSTPSPLSNNSCTSMLEVRVSA